MARFILQRGAALVPLLLLAVAAARAWQDGGPTGTITLEWDPNPEDTVTGYLVYVGTIPFHYGEVIDAGNATSFTYTPTLGRRRYFFAVAAYTPSEVGPRSNEVSAEGGPFDSGESIATVSTAPAAAPQQGLGRLRAGGLDRLTALAAADDGRLFVIEQDRTIRIVDEVLRAVRPALRADSTGTRFTEIVIDPSFGVTRHVFVGRITSRADGTREFSIVRYREVQSTLGQGAVIVAGLPLSGGVDPAFTVDGAGRIYVAMPAAGFTRSDPYAGYVLRFNADGSVPAENRAASPVFAHGYAVPTALAWDGGDLWIAGEDTRWPDRLARLRLDVPPGDPWPQMPTTLAVDERDAHLIAFDASRVNDSGNDHVMLALVDSDHQLHRLYLYPDGSRRRDTNVWPDDTTPTALAIGPERQVFVAQRSVNGASSIVEIMPDVRER